MDKTVVLGVGPCGLGAGLQLVSEGKEVDIIEISPRVGGASATLEVHDCLADYGPHVLHPISEDIVSIFKKFSRNGFYMDELITKLIIKGKLFSYPFKLEEGLTKFNPLFSMKIILDYLINKVRFIIKPREISSFKEWGIQSFGNTLYDLCFGKYTEQVWGMSADKISAKLAMDKLSALSLRKILVNLIKQDVQEKGYIYTKRFGYHRDGIGRIYEEMARHISENGGTLHLNSRIEEIRVKDNQVNSIVFSEDGKRREINCRNLISTIPLYSLVGYLSNKNDDVLEAAKKLRYRDLILVFFVINRERFSDAHWTYLLDSGYRFNRVSEQKNLMEKAAPKGKTSLCFEMCCNYRDHIWNSPDEKLIGIGKGDLKRLGVDGSEIHDSFVLRTRDAYPIYDLGFSENLDYVLGFLSGIKNLTSTGRHGLFLNIDMHDSIKLGMETARSHLTEE